MAELPQTTGRHRTERRMRYVLLALLPGILAMAFWLSPKVLLNLCIALPTAWASEALVMKLRGRSILDALQDGSITVMAVLLTVAVTPLLPWWQLMIGVLFASLLGKHVYGGLGQNLFNPAMVGFAVLLVSFPLTMSQWPSSSGMSAMDNTVIVDALSGATPLDRLHRLAEHANTPSAPTRADQLADSVWPWINLAWLAGGLFLAWRGALDWRVPLAVLLTLSTLHGLQSLLSPSPGLGPLLGVLAGASILGAFFIATDPVTMPAHPSARIVYGMGIATLTFLMREYSAYPEGMAFAILLMNMVAPALDRALAGPRA